MSKVRTLLKRYSEVESDLPVSDSTDKYSELVTSSGATGEPVQRWYRIKEGFSVHLFETLLDEWRIPVGDVQRVLDPFCGAGTTLLSVQRLAKRHRKDDMEVVGFERNPFLRFVSQAKSRWHSYDEPELAVFAKSLMNNGHLPKDASVPELSTLQRREVIDSRVLRTLLSYREEIESSPNTVRNALLMGYANSIEKVSGVRKDGRALRIMVGKKRASVKQALKTSWAAIREDLLSARSLYQPVNCKVYKGDGRVLRQDCCLDREHGRFDIAIYSPPYLNNIDYTEVYKLELWLCGFVDSRDAFRSLRYDTFRSHPSVKFREKVAMKHDRGMAAAAATVETIIEALPDDHNAKWRAALIQGYFDDLYKSLKSQRKALNKKGWVFCVIGNSLHGPAHDPDSRVPIAADLVTAQIASCLGFRVRGIQVARHLTRRYPGNGYLRESIIVLQKE